MTNKKRLVLLGGLSLIVVLVASLAGAALVFADEPTPTPEAPFCFHGRGFGLWGGSWTMFDTAAEALGLTPEEFFAKLHEGMSLAEIAEEQGVELEDVYDAMNADRVEAMRESIEQAVEDERITQEQADWLLEGLEQGFFPMGRGFGFGHGMKGGFGHGMRGGFGGFGLQRAPSVAPSSSSL
jgi:predicted nuclease with RNAse H fold